jgi:hypothetical protein
MKRALRYSILFAVASGTAFGASSRGVVTHRIGGCDYFLVQTAKGYAVLEWYGGYDPDKDDVIVGNFESYGSKDV